MKEMENNIVCPVCHANMNSGWYFCPNCGKELKSAPLNISIGKQIVIYLVSFFLTPLGLGWGLKYVVSKDPKMRMVGIISIALTILSIALLIGISKNFIDQYAKTLNNIIPSY